jgi:hypothetical protein
MSSNGQPTRGDPLALVLGDRTPASYFGDPCVLLLLLLLLLFVFLFISIISLIHWTNKQRIIILADKEI